MTTETDKEWKSVPRDGMPETGWHCFAAWNGHFWVKASCLEIKNRIVFCDFSERELKNITHYKYVGNGPAAAIGRGVE